MLYCERGGTGEPAVLLLHGLGATGAAWNRVRERLEHAGPGWIVPDLSGHGRSDWQAHYSVGQLAADVAEQVHDRQELLIVGHSLGVYVGLALASGWFNVRVAGVLGIGPKVVWTEADVARVKDLAMRPVQWFSSEREARARFRKVSGLDDQLAPGEECLARGVVQAPEGYRLAQDPRTFAVGGAPFDSLVRSARCPVILARGENDRLVSLEELRVHKDDARDLSGCGHNAHVGDPDAVVALTLILLGRCSADAD
jgi:pimeloyl-ACP methyl ester carboxylesterase